MRTHRIATIGPSSDDKKILTEMIRSGMTIARTEREHIDHPNQKA